MFKVIVVLIIGFVLSACDSVPPGHKGIKVNLYGGDKGVDETQELPTGRYWVGVTYNIYTFPTFTQNHVWTASKDEGSPTDESVDFQVEGVNINSDIGISWHIQEGSVPKVFQKYRTGVNEITHVVLRNAVRDALIKVGSSYKVEEVYSEKRSQVLQDTLKKVQDEMSPIGVVVENLFWVGKLRLPDSIENSINARLNALQVTQQRENEVKQVEAEARKVKAKADGDAAAKIAEANAEATAIRLKAEAEAAGMEAQARVLTNNPSLIQYNAVKNWNGGVPQVVGSGSVPFINIPLK